MKQKEIRKLLREAKKKPAWRKYLLDRIKGRVSRKSRQADIEIGFINHMNGHYPEQSAVEHIHKAFKQ